MSHSVSQDLPKLRLSSSDPTFFAELQPRVHRQSCGMFRLACLTEPPTTKPIQGRNNLLMLLQHAPESLLICFVFDSYTMFVRHAKSQATALAGVHQRPMRVLGVCEA